MQNLSDKDIDNLFKKVATESEPVFNPADWNDMARRLDKCAPTLSPFIKWTSIAAVVGTVIWLGLFSLQRSKKEVTTLFDVSLTTTKQELRMKPNELAVLNATPAIDSLAFGTLSEDSSPVISLTNHSAKQSGRGKKDEPTSGAQQQEKLSRNENAGNPEGVIKSVLTTNTVNTIDPSREANKNIEEMYDTRNMNSIEIISDPQGNNTRRKLLAITPPENTSENKKEFFTTITNQQDTTVNFQMPKSTLEHSVIDIASTENTNIDSVTLPTKLDKADSTSAVIAHKNPAVKKGNVFSRIVLKASITPDFSSEGFKKMDKTGLNYGVQIEYFLTHKVSIGTGAIWSRKFYSASDVRYQMFEIEQVQGDCYMWDIPVNLSYYVTPTKPYSVFISAGLSSYLMNSENYTFDLAKNYNGSQQYSMRVTNGNNEWFKIMNISVGLQGKLNKHLAFHVEPFLKIPLAEIGAGNVQLASFGSYFSLIYRFHQKNK